MAKILWKWYMRKGGCGFFFANSAHQSSSSFQTAVGETCKDLSDMSQPNKYFYLLLCFIKVFYGCFFRSLELRNCLLQRVTTLIAISLAVTNKLGTVRNWAGVNKMVTFLPLSKFLPPKNNHTFRSSEWPRWWCWSIHPLPFSLLLINQSSSLKIPWFLGFNEHVQTSSGSWGQIFQCTELTFFHKLGKYPRNTETPACKWHLFFALLTGTQY